MNFKAMAKTNNEREQNHLPKNNINDIKSQTYAKKIKKNKYSQFSKNKEDPLEVAIKEADEREKQSKFDISAPIRGTTVPTIAASPAIKRRNGNTDNNGNFSHQGNEKTVDFTKFKSIVPSDAYTFGYVQIGKVLGTHGIKGEMKVKLDNTDFATQHLCSGNLIFIKKPNRRAPRPIYVHSGRPQNKEVHLVKLKGISSREGALALKEYEVYVKANERPPLEDDEYLIRDLVECNCYAEIRSSTTSTSTMTMIGKIIGVVPPDELCSPSAAKLMHAMLEIEVTTTGALCLIPLVPSIVLNVHQQEDGKAKVIIDPPAGLLEQTYQQKKRIRIKGYLPAKAVGYS